MAEIPPQMPAPQKRRRRIVTVRIADDSQKKRDLRDRRLLLIPFLGTISTTIIGTGLYFFVQNVPGNPTMRTGLIVCAVGFIPLFIAFMMIYRTPLKRGIATFVVIGLVAWGVIEWIPAFMLRQHLLAEAPPTVEPSPPIATRVFLIERYGAEWHATKQEPILFADNGAFLRNRYVPNKEYSLTPTVANLSNAVLLDVEIYLNLPKEITVKKPKLWEETGPYEEGIQYRAQLPSVAPGTTNTVNEILKLTFPRPGRYKATYSVHGRSGTG